MQDWNLTDKVAGVENSGLENDVLGFGGLTGIW